MLEENSFGALLTYLRKRSKLVLARQGIGWTQAAVAEALEVSERTYKSWERGERVPDQHYLKKIAALFRLDTEDTDRFYREASQAPRRVHNFPFPRNPLFTGREVQLEQLKQALQETGSVALTQPVSLSGLGGIGKTQLALEYAYRNHPDIYHAVFWVNADSKEALEAGYKTIAQKLELPEQIEQNQAVQEWLERHTNWLLIMDNADNLQLARSYLPKVHQGHILLTTRSQIVSNIATPIVIERMSTAEGLHFLLRRSRKLQDNATLDTVAAKVREAAAQVVELLDGHPLALDQAGAYIEDNPLVSFTDYINLYHEKRRDLLSKRGSLDEENDGKYSEHPESVVVTFKLCFDQAHERHPLATDILHFCAFLDPDFIPYELFQYDESIWLNIQVFNASISALLRYSLIKPNNQENIYSMHRLVQAVLIDDMLPDTQKQWRARVVQSLIAAVPGQFDPDVVFDHNAEDIDAEFDRVSLPQLLLLQVEDVCTTWKWDELPPTVDLSVLFYKAAKYLVGQAMCTEFTSFWTGLASYAEFAYERAAQLYRLASEISEKRLGATHPDTKKYKKEYVESIRRKAEAAKWDERMVYW